MNDSSSSPRPPADHARFELRSAALADTLAIGRAVATLCREGDVLALAGELGAGKTQLVRGLAEGLGLDPARVASPTFVFLHEYEPAPPASPASPGSAGAPGSPGSPDDNVTPRLTLIHLDAYRLTGSDDLATIGFDLDDPDYRAGCVVAIEWPQRLGPSIDPGLTFTLEHAPPSRRITVIAHSAWRNRLDPLQHEITPFQTP